MKANDPLDTMTLDRTANRAMEAEINSYAAYACEQGVTGIVVDINLYGEKRAYNAFVRRAKEGAEIIERRELAGLKFYEAFMLDEMYDELSHQAARLRHPDIQVYGGVMTLSAEVSRPADPVYLRARQYSIGSFIK